MIDKTLTFNLITNVSHLEHIEHCYKAINAKAKFWWGMGGAWWTPLAHDLYVLWTNIHHTHLLYMVWTDGIHHTHLPDVVWTNIQIQTFY